MKAEVELTFSETTDSILLGYVVADFETQDFKGSVVASGKIVRVDVEGYDGYVDIDIRSAVAKAITMITKAPFGVEVI